MMIDRDYIKSNTSYLVGADEVGRGPLAGPVVAAASMIKSDSVMIKLEALRLLGVTDSKRLTDKRRIRIIEKLGITRPLKKEILLEDYGIKIMIKSIGPGQIDKINILEASLRAMKKASYGLRKSPDTIYLVDGNKTFDKENENVVPIVKGDSKSILIGVASIFAKVYRDDLMSKYAKKYPYYSFEKNAGYPTQKHREAITIHGITPIHRKSFKGVIEHVTSSLPERITKRD